MARSVQNAHPSIRYRLIATLVTSFLGGGILGFIFLVAFVEAFIIAPWQTYQSTTANFWAPYNPKAYQLQSSKDFEQARAELSRLATSTRFHQDPIPVFILGNLHQTLEQPQQAMHYYNESLNRIKNHPLGWYSKVLFHYFAEESHASLAQLYYERHLPKQAQAELAQIHEVDNLENPDLAQALQDVLDEPDRADAHLALAQAYRHTLALDAAHQELEQTLALSHDPHTRLATEQFIRYKMPRRGARIHALTSYYMKAADYNVEKQDNWDQAAVFYDQAIAADPDFEWPYYQIGLLYRDISDLSKAREYTEKALVINPDFHLSYLALGELALDAEQYDQAALYFAKAQRISTLFRDSEEEISVLANIENQLAYSYEAMQNASEAALHYQKVLELTPEASDDYHYAELALERIQQEHHVTANARGLKKSVQ